MQNSSSRDERILEREKNEKEYLLISGTHENTKTVNILPQQMGVYKQKPIAKNIAS